MIDMHSHILFGIDDGAKDWKMTLEMFKIAQNDGITTMVATPHYVAGANQYNLETLQNRYEEVVQLIKKNGIEIELLLGNELYLDEYTVPSLTQGQCHRLGETAYILIELPILAIPAYTEQVLYGLLRRGYRPVIAHPERYIDIQKNPNRLIPYLEMGCMTQINSTSIEGMSGQKARETARLLLEHHMVNLVASDCHSNRGRRPVLSGAYDQVKIWIGQEEGDRIFLKNPEKLLKNKMIEAKEPMYIQERKTLHSKLIGYFNMEKS